MDGDLIILSQSDALDSDKPDRLTRLCAYKADHDDNFVIVLWHVNGEFDQAYLDDRFQSESCHHAHDCCGQWYCNGWYPLKDPNGNSRIIAVTYTQNI